MPGQEIVAYCLKCREKRPVESPQPTYTASGRPATRGTCPVCGTALFKMGRTEAHASIPKPEVKAAAGPSRKKRTGKGKLVIVESPAKARTLRRFLGREFQVEASMGHIRDLLRSKLSVDVENDFAPTYRVPKEKRKVVNRLKDAASQAKEVYLATDPDREGEAIAWHLLAAAAIPDDITRRVAFHEITQEAVAEAFSQPRTLDMDLINAQQARRILDRLVGYKISPLLWRKVRNRLSAGRVQSVAVRLIVEREREIQAFVPVEYWSIKAELAKQDTRDVEPRPTFIAKLLKIEGQDVDLKDEPATQAVVDDLEDAHYLVSKVRKSQRRRRPPAPFITSTMQQEASSKLGFVPKRTMAVAQQLYEGVDLGRGERVGLITYMRTDSTNVAAPALAEVRAYIQEKFGPDYLPAKPPVHKTRAVKAQEAHECIRPTSVRREPDAIKQHLDKDQYRLYKLIWQRFVASQMKSAVYDVTSVDVKAGRLEPGTAIPEGRALKAFLEALPYLFRATHSTIAFPGFLLVYEEVKGEEEAEEDSGTLPPLDIGELLDLIGLIPEQHFTQPPPRFTEASLIRELEKHGIGRPSTYAPILSTIQIRGYVDREKKYLIPTELGFIVNDLLVEHFPDVVDVPFTAHMEDDLDRIAAGERDWVAVLREFYEPFERRLGMAKRNMQKVEIEPEETGLTCEKCGHPMVVKMGRYGEFIACSNFPDCRNTKPYMIQTGAKCPQCGGDLVERKTRKGRRTFYGCTNYPECGFAVWQRPLPQPCPNCGGLMTETGKNRAKCTQCNRILEREGETETGT